MQEITKETYLDWYENMFFWRKFEDKLAAVYIQQKVRGFLHLYNGQEAVLAGALHAMDLSKDKMITAYRNHVQPIGMGVDPRRVMAELYGKATGTSQGLGGSMHIFSKEHGFYGGHGIVGGQIPLGAGMAFGDKYNETGAVTLCYFGDGAARQGSLHASRCRRVIATATRFSWRTAASTCSKTTAAVLTPSLIPLVGAGR